MSLIFATQLTAIAATALALLALVTAVCAILDHASSHPSRWAGDGAFTDCRMLRRGHYAVAVMPASSMLACHSRAAAVVL